MNKILLYIKIRKFYNIFGEVVGSNFITKLSDMTADNVHDVLFDINEVADNDDDWLNKLQSQIINFCDRSPLTLNSVLFNICNTKKNGFYELRPYTKPIYKLAQYLYKKGVM